MKFEFEGGFLVISGQEGEKTYQYKVPVDLVSVSVRVPKGYPVGAVIADLGEAQASSIGGSGLSIEGGLVRIAGALDLPASYDVVLDGKPLILEVEEAPGYFDWSDVRDNVTVDWNPSDNASLTLESGRVAGLVDGSPYQRQAFNDYHLRMPGASVSRPSYVPSSPIGGVPSLYFPAILKSATGGLFFNQQPIEHGFRVLRFEGETKLYFGNDFNRVTTEVVADWLGEPVIFSEKHTTTEITFYRNGVPIVTKPFVSQAPGFSAVVFFAESRGDGGRGAIMSQLAIGQAEIWEGQPFHGHIARIFALNNVVVA
jgi:hypothetical protein